MYANVKSKDRTNTASELLCTISTLSQPYHSYVLDPMPIKHTDGYEVPLEVCSSSLSIRLLSVSLSTVNVNWELSHVKSFERDREKTSSSGTTFVITCTGTSPYSSLPHKRKLHIKTTQRTVSNTHNVVTYS
jgi:hypothetical protein